MLQAMRDRVMGVLGWIVIGLIIITFALFGLGSYLQDKTRLYAAKVNDTEITPRELQFAYQNQRARMEQMLGDAFNPALFDEKVLKQQALEGLIRRQLVLQAAEADGMAVSDQLLAAQIHSVPAFQDKGAFDQERYQRLLAQQGRTPAGFESETRRMLVADQLINGISNTTFVTDAEVNRAYAIQEQKRSFEYATVAAEPLEADIKPGDAEIEAYYEAHKNAFMTPARVRLDYVRLNSDVLGQGIEVGEDALKAYYEQKKASLKTQEQRRASHILFQLPADADKATVDKTRAEAEKVLKQIRGGADFAALAKKYSGDPGSAAKGGDLGYFATGAMVPEFDKTVFAMHKGDVSDLVRSQFGFHIIKLVDIKGSVIPPLEEVRASLIKELKQHDIDDRYYEQLEQLTDVSYENPGNLQVAADALGLTIQTTDWISAADGAGIGKFPKVRSAAFAEDVLENGNNSEPVEVAPNDAIVLHIKDREDAHPKSLADIRATIVATLKREQAAQAAEAAGQKLLKQIADGADLKTLAAKDHYAYQAADGVTRGAPGHTGELAKDVFRLPRPSAAQAVDKGFAMTNGDYVVVRLKSVEDADPAGMTDAQRTQLKRSVENMRRSLALFDLTNALHDKAEIEIPKDDDGQP